MVAEGENGGAVTDLDNLRSGVVMVGRLINATP